MSESRALVKRGVREVRPVPSVSWPKWPGRATLARIAPRQAPFPPDSVKKADRPMTDRPRPSRLLLLAAALIVAGSSPASTAPPEGLTDEFDNAATLADWQRVYAVESWGADQLEAWDIDGAAPGWMSMTPYASSWYEDYRGVLAFKEVTGDFAMTTRIRPRRRNGQPGAPNSQYSLAGIMTRAPRNITPATWTPDGENYVFLSMGAADTPGSFQFEVKTTEDGTSILQISNALSDEAILQTARIGGVFIMMRQEPGQPWTVHRRYARSDMPATLQVGLTCYTDWATVQGYDPFVHNQTVIDSTEAPGANPDLVAQFDYARYATPVVPVEFAGVDFSDPGQITDEELLTFLGESLAGAPSAVADWQMYE